MATTYKLRYPCICLACKTSFRRRYSVHTKILCPHCAGETHLMTRFFKTPPKDDKKQWEKITFLVNRGYRFGYVIFRDRKKAHYVPFRIPYPKTLEEAKEFVKMYAPATAIIKPATTTNRAKKRLAAKQVARRDRVKRRAKVEYVRRRKVKS